MTTVEPIHLIAAEITPHCRDQRLNGEKKEELTTVRSLITHTGMVDERNPAVERVVVTVVRVTIGIFRT